MRGVLPQNVLIMPCGFMVGSPWMMLLGSIVWLLIVALLVLGIVALWKYIKK
jgi:hypothetical protein